MNRLKLFRYLLIASLPILLVSCFAAKDYERPEVINGQSYRTDEIVQDTTTIADVSWREFFNDTILKNHIDEALTNNIDIRVALQQINAAQAFFKQGKAAYFPTLSANAQYTRNELSSNSQFGGQFSSLNTYELSASTSWEADIWGKITSQKEAFRARYLQTIAAHKAVKTELIAEVANAYYALVALDEQIKITENTIDTRANGLETTKSLKDAGSLTGVAVKQTEAQLYFAQSLLIDLKNESRLTENTLSILLGKEPEAISRDSLSKQRVTTDLKTGVPAQLLRNRPDVMAAEYNFANAFQLTNVARSNFYPSLTINATGGFQSLQLDQLLSSSSLFASIIGGLTQPIFNKRQIKTEYEVSQSEQEQSRLNFRGVILQATKEVSDALYNYEASTEKIDLKEKEVEAYLTATDYSEELVTYGLANYLEVLNARERALSARLEMVTAKQNQLQAMVNLYKAVGGGWE